MEQQTPARPPGRPQVLEGRVAIVTGSSRGLGKAIATGLAEAGATVVVSSRKPEQCDITAEEIRRTTGATVLSRACHMGSWDEIPGLVGDVVAAFGGINVVVNNAGMMPALVEAVDIDLGYWRKIFSVNLEGPLRLSQLVAPIMRERGGGTIVNISSVAAYYGGMRGNSAYPAAKAGLVTDSQHGSGMGAVEDPSQRGESWSVPQPDERRRRAQQSRLLSAVGCRDDARASRRH